MPSKNRLLAIHEFWQVKNPFSKGDHKHYIKVVSPEEIARFDAGTVHEVYSTFSLARDAEWSTRQFVLDMKEDDEEGIGTFIEVNHHAPALVGSEVRFLSYIEEVNGHEVICRFEARVGEQLIATGKTGQKILKKEKVMRLMEKTRGDSQ